MGAVRVIKRAGRCTTAAMAVCLITIIGPTRRVAERPTMAPSRGLRAVSHGICVSTSATLRVLVITLLPT